MLDQVPWNIQLFEVSGNSQAATRRKNDHHGANLPHEYSCAHMEFGLGTKDSSTLHQVLLLSCCKAKVFKLLAHRDFQHR